MSKTQELDDLISGEQAAPPAEKKRGRKPKADSEAFKAAQEAQLAEATLHEGEPPPAGDEEPDYSEATSGPETYDLEPGTVLRIPEDYTLRRCMRCKIQYVAPKAGWRQKSCPPCYGDKPGEAAEEPVQEVAPVQSVAQDPLELFQAIESDKGILSRILAAASYSGAFGLTGTVDLEISSGKIVGTTKFKEELSGPVFEETSIEAVDEE